MAWVQNDAGVLIDPQGRFQRTSQETMVAMWNPETHSFDSPIALTNNSVSDVQPAVHVGENGSVQVTWLQDSEFDADDHVVIANQVMFSEYDDECHNVKIERGQANHFRS